MRIKHSFTNAGIEDGQYGRYYTNKDGKSEFRGMGDVVEVTKIVDNLETKEVTLQLAFETADFTVKKISVPRSELGDLSIIKTLAGMGADVTKGNADIFVDSLRLQEKQIKHSGQGVTYVYDHLGWTELPCFDEETGAYLGTCDCFRANQLIGGEIPAEYVGEYAVEPTGSFQIWRDMVIHEVLGHEALEIILLVGLSAVVNGLIAPDTTHESPIFHVSYASGKGKSTAGFLAVSTIGKPFDGIEDILKDGERCKKTSLYQSWGATENAVITGQSGNRGAVVVLNEISRLNKKADVTRILYDLVEGRDKRRSNSENKTYESDHFCTAFISLGESSLLDRCKEKQEGIANRVVEIEKPLTASAEHSRKIKEVCTKNNGHAAPRLANYILKNGGIDSIVPIFKHFIQQLDTILPEAPSGDRFIEKFGALLMTTATLATAALGIPFDLERVQRFLIEYEFEKGQERDTSAASYDLILEECRAHINNFYRKGYPDPTSQDIWGRVKQFTPTPGDPKPLIEEYEVRPSKVKKILEQGGFTNLKTCVDSWKRMGVLDFDPGHSTRSRKIMPGAKGKEPVYVFKVFGTTAAQQTTSSDQRIIPMQPEEEANSAQEEVG